MDTKATVKVELAKREMTMLELAAQLGIPQQSLSRTLQTSPVNQRSHWPAILEALGLEVIIRPKQS
ncbi:transcriptional regulator [Deinococcus alpinitundrae]|uniref:transcriptional regulator n=1 Tax=Deinococcus alpinitundrae TaxID=468913 RepID=UPI00137A9EEB|nr:transcriptional regulator [Deinococcus alpinitundrae]